MRSDLRKISHHASMHDRTSIIDRRHRLAKRIRAFHRKKYISPPDAVDDEPEIVTNPLTFDEDVIVDNNEEVEDDMGWDVDDEGALDEEEQEDREDIDPSEDEEEDHFPEKMQLMMPSSLNRADIFRLNLEALAAQELELRKGQANDSLENLRLQLAHKALLWKTKVQAANTTKKRTRAWDDIKKARDRVEQHVRSYHRARRALINLGANLDVMERYKSIERSDLALSGDVVDPGRLGQRNDSLAWFWRQGGSHPEQNNQWMQECESCVFLNTFYKLTCQLQSIE